MFVNKTHAKTLYTVSENNFCLLGMIVQLYMGQSIQEWTK